LFITRYLHLVLILGIARIFTASTRYVHHATIIDIGLGNRVFQFETARRIRSQRRNAAAPLGEQHIGHRIVLQRHIARVGHRNRVRDDFARFAYRGLVGRLAHLDSGLLLTRYLHLVLILRIIRVLTTRTDHVQSSAVLTSE